MIKYFMLHARNPAIGQRDLIEYYEDRFVRSVADLLPFIRQHRRHYVSSDRSPALVAAELPFTDPGFDMIAEFVLANGADARRMAKAMTQPGIGSALGLENSAVFNTRNGMAFAAQASATPPEHLARRPDAHAGPPAVQTFVLIRRNPALCRDQFVAHYENRHTSIVLTHLVRGGLPLFARYVRNFPVDANGSLPIGQFGVVPAPYDCFGEVAYWTEDDARQFAPIMSRADVADVFEADGKIMLDGGCYHQIQVETREDCLTLSAPGTRLSITDDFRAPTQLDCLQYGEKFPSG